MTEKVCSCGTHHSGPSSLCPMCVCRENRDLHEPFSWGGAIRFREQENRPANEARIRGCG
jgi:hypothetical protein